MKRLIPLFGCLISAWPLFAEEMNPPLDSAFTSQAPEAPIAENPEVEAQVAGQYPRLERQESLPLGAIQRAWDTAAPNAGVYVVHFHPFEVIRFTTREFMTTSIVFPAWESISSVSVGDETAYRVTQPKPNILLVRASEFVGVDSSLTAVGESGHVYAFYVRSEGYNSDKISDLTVHVRAPIPESVLHGAGGSVREMTAAQRTDYLESVVFEPSKLDFAFNMAGDKTIAPERVFSDGIRTWFDYGPDIGSKTLPAIYAVIDGVDTPVNVSREGDKIVADAVGRFTLKSGHKITCVTPYQPKRKR